VVCLGNYIDPINAHKSKENKTGKYRIGFVGSVSSNDDYAHIKGQIRTLAERGDITIVVFGVKRSDGSVLGAYENDLEFWESLPNVEWQPFVAINKYYYTLSRLALDLAIIPRKESYFNQCKSNVKFLECSLLGIPVIAQGFTDKTSPYQQNPKDSEHMVIVEDNDIWYDEIVSLLENKNKRIDMARKAKEYVLTNYNIKDNAYKWRYALSKI